MAYAVDLTGLVQYAIRISAGVEDLVRIALSRLVNCMCQCANVLL